MQHSGLYSAFHEQAMSTPDAWAVHEEETRFSYKEIETKAASVTQLLVAQGLQSNELVAIRYGPGIDQIVCQIGTVLANGVCFPVDPSLPEARLQSLLQQARVRYVFSYDALKDYENSSLGVETTSERDPIQLFQSTATYAVQHVHHNVTHILHTSGSTGKPKLVQISGTAIMNIATNTDVTPLRADDRMLCLNNPSFDLALFEIWATLLSGGEIVIVPRDSVVEGHMLHDFIRRQGVTVGFLSTGHFNHIASTCPKAFSPLRLLLFAGSVVSPSAIRNIFENEPPQQLWNAYGPTEATVFATLHQIDFDEAKRPRIAVGRPVGDIQVTLRDSSGEVITDEEETGEICLRGPGISIGYLNDDEESERKFVDTSTELISGTKSPDLLYKTGDMGCFRKGSPNVLEFVGRYDRQVKHNTYRVELGEVEAVLNGSQLSQEAHVLQVESPNDDTQQILVACVRLHESDKSTLSSIREYCVAHLPAYMVPNQVMSMDTIPLNARGKVDYASLEQEICRRLSTPAPDTQRSSNSMLEEVWSGVLGTSGAQADDDFFRLCATSLQAAQLTVKIRKTFGKHISLQDLYEHPRFADMAQYIESRNAVGKPDHTALIDRMKADSCLADSILPQTGPISHRIPNHDEHFLVTGATGFLGAFFLKDLISNVSRRSPITCLVRSSDKTSSGTRLRNALEKYDLWDDRFEGRIHVVDGNFAMNHFGLTDDEFSRLADAVSTIFHFGAHVNFCQPYQEHFEANILGTKNILHFASTGRSKCTHYASTIDAWGATGLINGTKSLLEDESLEPHIQGPLHDTGYSQSQWVAEQIVRRARDRGFSVSIYRLGTVIGDSKRGAGNPNDFFARVLVGSAKLGLFPLIKDLRWEYVPVDYACAAIRHISRSQSNVGRSYSIVSPDPTCSVSLERTGELLQKAGHPVKLVPYQNWVAALSEDQRLSTNPLLALMPLIREPVLGELTRFETSQKTPTYRSDNTKDALAHAADIEYVQLNAQMLRMMFDFWAKKGYHVI
jgi:amino acid adenylation domain-containing protein/thioester reductase-like protein